MDRQKALEVSNTLGVNILGQSLAIMQVARDALKDNEEPHTFDDVVEEWGDCGNDYLYHEFLGCEGHMSSLQVATLKDGVKEFLDDNLDTCASWEDLEALCKEEEA